MKTKEISFELDNEVFYWGTSSNRILPRTEYVGKYALRRVWVRSNVPLGFFETELLEAKLRQGLVNIPRQGNIIPVYFPLINSEEGLHFHILGEYMEGMKKWLSKIETQPLL